MDHSSKRHHYVSQFFLRGFSIDRKNLWVFDKEKKEFRFQNTIQIASENKFYTYKVKGKEENLEDVFGQIESLAKPILEKIKNRDPISEQEKADFAMFIAVSKVRVPDFKKRTEEGSEKMYKKMNKITFSNKERVKEMAKRARKKLSEKDIGELMEFATDEKRYYVKFPSNYWLGTMLKLSLDVARSFIISNWQFQYYSKKFALITSDNPVILVPPPDYDRFWGVGLLTPGVRHVFSLTSNICLIIGDMKENPTIEYREVNDKNAYRWLNKITLISSDRFTYSPDKGKLEKLVKENKEKLEVRKERISVS